MRPGNKICKFILNISKLVRKKKRKKEDKLKLMFCSDEWGTCKWSKSVKGSKATTATVLSYSFWSGVNIVLQVFAPLVKVLDLLNGDRKPSIDFLIGGLEDAYSEIKDKLKTRRVSTSLF